MSVPERVPEAGASAAEGELLRLVPGCEDGRPPLALAPLAGGSVNRTLLVHSREGRFVVRIAGAAGERLGVNRRREAAFQSLAASAGLAPPIIAASPDARVLVAEYIPGRTWTEADFRDGSALQRLGERVRALQRLAVPAALAAPQFDPLAALTRLAAPVSRAVPREARLIERVLTQARAHLESGGGARAPTVVHLDLHPANIVEGERLVFLDWEYAACADPALELASLLASAPWLARELDRLLAASGLDGAVSPRALTALARVFEATHWLWYRARRLDAVPAPLERAAERSLRRRLGR